MFIKAKFFVAFCLLSPRQRKPFGFVRPIRSEARGLSSLDAKTLVYSVFASAKNCMDDRGGVRWMARWSEQWPTIWGHGKQRSDSSWKVILRPKNIKPSFLGGGGAIEAMEIGNSDRTPKLSLMCFDHWWWVIIDNARETVKQVVLGDLYQTAFSRQVATHKAA